MIRFMTESTMLGRMRRRPALVLLAAAAAAAAGCSSSRSAATTTVVAHPRDGDLAAERGRAFASDPPARTGRRGLARPAGAGRRRRLVRRRRRAARRAHRGGHVARRHRHQTNESAALTAESSNRLDAEHLGAVIFLKLLIMAVAIPLGMGVAIWMGGTGPETWAILLCFLGAMIFRETPTVVAFAVFLACERMEFRALVTLVYQIVKIAATLLVIFMGGGIVAIFGALLAAEASQGLLALRLLLKRFFKPKLIFDWPRWKILVKEAFPLGVAFALNNYYFQIDILVLKYFRTIKETGLFGVPFRIISTLFALLIPTVWILLPHLTQAYKESVARLHQDGQGYLKAIFVVTAGIAIYLCLESRDLTLSLFGSKFEAIRVGFGRHFPGGYFPCDSVLFRSDPDGGGSTEIRHARIGGYFRRQTPR